jgi:hypothetical protein
VVTFISIRLKQAISIIFLVIVFILINYFTVYSALIMPVLTSG